MSWVVTLKLIYVTSHRKLDLNDFEMITEIAPYTYLLTYLWS
jgi:hypothetical protein